MRAAASLLMLLGCVVTTRAQSTPPTVNAVPIPAEHRYRYRLLGVFDQDSGDPVEGVEVIDVLTGTKTVTGKAGTVSLFFLPDGGSLVRLRKVGYELQTVPVSITPKDTVPITVVFAKATQLATVVVEDSNPPLKANRLKAFEERRKTGFGSFISEAELRKHDARALAQVIPNYIPGVMAIAADRTSSATYLVARRTMCSGRVFLDPCMSNSCVVRVYLDDAPLLGYVDFARLNTDEYAGVEYYAGGASIPPKYNSTDARACGVLLLWTRDR